MTGGESSRPIVTWLWGQEQRRQGCWGVTRLGAGLLQKHSVYPQAPTSESLCSALPLSAEAHSCGEECKSHQLILAKTQVSFPPQGQLLVEKSYCYKLNCVSQSLTLKP